jgi:hypothetical protein
MVKQPIKPYRCSSEILNALDTRFIFILCLSLFEPLGGPFASTFPANYV